MKHATGFGHKTVRTVLVVAGVATSLTLASVGISPLRQTTCHLSFVNYK